MHNLIIEGRVRGNLMLKLQATLRRNYLDTEN